jgi:hypothetical protein
MVKLGLVLEIEEQRKVSHSSNKRASINLNNFIV